MMDSNWNGLRALPWIALMVAFIAIALLAFQLANTRRQLADQRRWQETIIDQIGAAVGRDGERGAPLTADESGEALARIVATRDGSARMLADLSTARNAAVLPAATLAPTAATARTEIARLGRTQSTGSAAGDARIIEQDSRAAWSGWK